MPRVSIGSGGSASAEVTIARGASIEGQVRYEDGEPAPEVHIMLQRQVTPGKWESMPQGLGLDRKLTDGKGRFQLDGLLPGKYLVKAELLMERRFQDRLMGGSHSLWSSTTASVTLYSGDTPRLSAAKAIKLHEGEQAMGQDIVVPVSSLHTVTGSVVDERTGQALNAGSLLLMYAEDHSIVATANINPETRTFAMEFVPEGKFILIVHSPREGVPGTSEHDHGSPMPSLTTVRIYEGAEMPLIVHSDSSGVTLAVKEMAAPRSSP